MYGGSLETTGTVPLKADKDGQYLMNGSVEQELDSTRNRKTLRQANPTRAYNLYYTMN